MISSYYGKNIRLPALKKNTLLRKVKNLQDGISLQILKETAISIGFESDTLKASYIGLKEEVNLPCIALINEKHYVIVHEISDDSVSIADPAKGFSKISATDFSNLWFVSQYGNQGILLSIIPSNNFWGPLGKIFRKWWGIFS
jgi:ATP-binding cassette subfamily B protein